MDEFQAVTACKNPEPEYEEHESLAHMSRLGSSGLMPHIRCVRMYRSIGLASSEGDAQSGENLRGVEMGS